MTKNVLCYGDANTWGCVPIESMDNIQRFSREERWTGVLQKHLGDDYYVIEEGCPARTTVWDDPIEGDKNGKSHLRHILSSHQPLDLVMILLGTNDLKARFGVRAYDIALSAGTLVSMVRDQFFYLGETPQVLLLAPPPVYDELPEFFEEIFYGAQEKSKKFGQYFKQVAEDHQCGFLDTGTVITSSEVDAIHFDINAHTNLANALANKVRAMIG